MEELDMRGLLNYSLERISSLQYFYNFEKKSIENKAKRGMKVARFGYLMDIYFQILVNGTEEDRKKESFLQLKKQAEKYIEVRNEEEIQNHETRGVIYRIKNPEKLIKKGFELNVQKASSSYRQFYDMPIIHGSNTLIMLITRFEEFISNFISELYTLYPHKYLDKQQILFSEIESLGIEAIRQKIIAREVDSIMRESYVEWFKLFESHGMKFDSCKTAMEKLKEIYARRNIVVHNAGRVNEIYIKNVPDTPHAVNDHLSINDKYLNEAFTTVKIIVFTILIEAVKLIREDKNKYLHNIFEAAYDELVQGQYSLCANIFFQLACNSYVDAQTRTMSQVNYWTSEKVNRGLEKIKEEIEQFDVSALDRVFSLAKALLLNKNDEATDIFESLYQKNELPFYIIEEWPLFMDYRNSDYYDMIKNKYKEELGTAMLETGPEILAADKNIEKNIHEEIEVAELPTGET